MSGETEGGWVAELRQLADAAAPAPWFTGWADDEAYMTAEFVSTEQVAENAWPPERSTVAITQLQHPRYAGNEFSEENARFIAAARTGVPRLCDALDRALDERAALSSALRAVLKVAEMAGATIEFSEALERGHRLLGELGDG